MKEEVTTFGDKDWSYVRNYDLVGLGIGCLQVLKGKVMYREKLESRRQGWRNTYITQTHTHTHMHTLTRAPAGF